MPSQKKKPSKVKGVKVPQISQAQLMTCVDGLIVACIDTNAQIVAGTGNAGTVGSNSVSIKVTRKNFKIDGKNFGNFEVIVKKLFM